MSERFSDQMQEILLSIVEVAPLAVVGQRLAEAALDLTGADYAAIGAYDSRNQLEHWVPVGVDPADERLMGHPPIGSGLLGAFAETSDAILLEDAADHPTASGMPEHHPPMGPFLGVPVVYAGRSIGAFYVTRAPGGAPFTEDDQQQLADLAPYAALAMANARAFERERRRAQAAEALQRAAAELQEALDEREVAEVLMRTLCSLFDSSPCAAVIWSTDPTRPYRHALESDAGTLAAALERCLRGEISNGEHRRTDLLEGDEVALQLAGDETGRVALAVATGTLSVDLDMSPLRELAALGSDSLAAVRRRSAEASLERYALRDEIARDLHDDLIQSIYAIGLGLRAASGGDAERLRGVLATASDELNEVIRELRAYIAQLSHGPESIGSSGLLAARVAALLRGPADRPKWSHRIEIGDVTLTPDLERQLYLIVREAVSNVQRHARAERASLELTVEGEALRLVVHDDGVGFDRRDIREGAVGLRSVEERVASVGGSVMIESHAGEGTTITATFPLSPGTDVRPQES